ncbi:MAG TPA: Spy/CpxP family protein refolding chaperone [Casimicrobiaceae bacterium]|nr:Spy/CpxP family protein refolding chaperone [Casimicrobiaceae bacterium]
MRSRLTLLALLCAVFLTDACAQIPGRGGMGGGDRMRGSQRAPSERTAPTTSPGAATQVQLDALEDELKLTATQRQAWNAYADRVQKLADETSRLIFEARTGRTPAGTAVAQLEAIAGVEHAKSTAVDEIVLLARDFYATLTPEQRSLADRRLASVVAALVTGIYRTTAAARSGS